MRRSPAQSRERRQSGRLTRRELKQSISRSGRKWLKEVWQAAALASSRITRLSPVTSPLGYRLLEGYEASEHLESAEIHRALRVMTAAGYATRIVLAEPTGQPSLTPSAFGLSAQPDLERLAADTARLMDPVRRIAEDRFESVMSLPPQVWSAYVATATMNLQGQLTTKTLSWQHLGRGRIEQMLRYGYVLRCLDEAIGAEPELRDL